MVVDERVATRHDLAGLEQRIDLRVDERFNAMDHRITAVGFELRAAFEHEMRSQSSTFEQGLRALITTVVFGLASVVLTMAGLAFALVRFT